MSEAMDSKLTALFSDLLICISQLKQVHERSLDSDFLLLMLKEVLARNKNIKVILVRI